MLFFFIYYAKFFFYFSVIFYIFFFFCIYYNKNMGGGLMQLVAYGAQDIYLTGNPQITFFKVVYRRHTNFSMEAIEQTTNGQTTSARARITSTISRNGDLIYRIYHQVKNFANASALCNMGANIFDTIEI